MNRVRLQREPAHSHALRLADGPQIARALESVRGDTLAALAAWERGLADPQMAVPYSTQFNPPRWEFGHVGYFQEFWICRNPQRHLGIGADPAAPRSASRLALADAWFDSSRVEHASRWSLPLPDAGALRDYLARVLDDCLITLGKAGGDPASRLHGTAYFGWLALVHEQMHLEAARYMANALAIAPAPGAPAAPAAPALERRGRLTLGPARFELGAGDEGYAFDNELQRHAVQIDRFEIDAAPVDNAAFVSFIEAGGYAERRWWTGAGWDWRCTAGARHPRFWRRQGQRWQQRWFGTWTDLQAHAPVSNVTLHEAEAWCHWAGRRLPTESEWEYAALTATGFGWGEVWEWTATAFAPYPGFSPHPYRDYSQPWFGTRQVLRGASFATHPQLVDPRYRNFFTPERNDIFAGFRSCA